MFDLTLLSTILRQTKLIPSLEKMDQSSEWSPSRSSTIYMELQSLHSVSIKHLVAKNHVAFEVSPIQEREAGRSILGGANLQWSKD